MEAPAQQQLFSTEEARESFLGIDVFEYLAIARRRWLVMVLILIVVVTAGVVYTIRLPKLYQAQATIILKSETIKPLGRQVEEIDAQDQYYWLSRDYRATQVRVIISIPVLKNVVDELGLATDYQFLGLDELAPEEAAQVRGKLNPVTILANKIQVDMVQDSELVLIKVKDRDPERARILADAVVRGYNKLRRENQLGMVTSASGWLDEQTQTLRATLDEAEHKLYTFQKENNIEATSFDEYQKLIAQRQFALTEELQRAKANQWQSEVLLKTLHDTRTQTGGIMNSPVIETNDTIKRLNEQVITQEQAFIKISAELGPKHPTYQIALTQLEDARTTLTEELDRLIKRAENRKAELDRLLQHVDSEVTAVRKEAMRLNEISIEYQRINYQITNLRSLYALVLKRSKEAQISGATRFLDVEVVENASTPLTHVYPRTTINILFSFILGLVLSVLAVILMESIDTKLTGHIEAERIIERPFLGGIAAINLDSKVWEERIHALAAEQRQALESLDARGKIESLPVFFPKSNISEAIRLIRTNLLFLSMESQYTTLLVTSAHPREGKSTFINYLSLSFAALDKRIAVLDADLHKPMLHRIYKLDNQHGMSTYLTGHDDLDAIVQPTPLSHIDAITSGPIPPNSAELLSSARFEALMVDLRKRYDYILIDSPPMLAVSDSLIVSRAVQAIVLVVQPALTDRNALRLVVRQLKDIRAPLCGFIFNNIVAAKSGFGGGRYYSRYGRFYHYGYDYQYGYSSSKHGK